MRNFKLPPQIWFDSAHKVISAAKLHMPLDDFKQQSKLNTYTIGESYSDRIAVLNRLVRDEVVLIADRRLRLGSLDNIEWLNDALEAGVQSAWTLALEVDSSLDEQKKFDSDRLKRIGDNGEQFVIQSLMDILDVSIHDQIIHVAKYNDMAGYDIYSPSTLNSDNKFKLEVKTSTRKLSNMFEFYLSRNEYEVGRKNRDWCIVCVGHYESKGHILGHIYSYQIESRLPKDMDKNAQWMNCRVKLNLSHLREGLP